MKSDKGRRGSGLQTKVVFGNDVVHAAMYVLKGPFKNSVTRDTGGCVCVCVCVWRGELHVVKAEGECVEEGVW